MLALGVGSITLGQMNLKKNSPLNEAIRGIPTVEIYPAYDKKNPLVWNSAGEKTAEKLLGFIAKAVNSVN